MGRDTTGSESSTDEQRGTDGLTDERMRKRFARRQRARRWGVWRPVLAIVLVLLLGVAVGWAVWFSSLLAVESVSVRGVDHLTDDQVRNAAGVDSGTPLIKVDLAGVESRVEALAPVVEARAHRDWPHTVRVTVTEREPVAVAQIGGTLRGMDDTGVVFRDYPKVPKGLPRVRVGNAADRDALAEAATVLSAMPDDLARKVRWVDVQSIDQISLVLRSGRTVLWGSGEASQDKAAVLAALLKARKAKNYDVSVPGQPVVSG